MRRRIEPVQLKMRLRVTFLNGIRITMSVYIIVAAEGGLAKIGHSAHPRDRLSKMNSDSPALLSIASLLDGGVELEAELHARFKHLRERGEWFRVAGELQEFILSNPAPQRAAGLRQWNKPAASDLAERRRDLNLSQQQLALLLGVSQGTVSRNETSSNPDRRYALSIEALAARKERGEDLAATADSACAA